MSLYGELEMRNSFFREHQAKDCHEIAKLKRTCREETDRARQARIDELSMQQERNPTTERSSSGATHVPSQLSTVPSPRTHA